MTKPLFSIAIDGNEANVSHRVGSNVFAHSLLSALYDLRPPEMSFTVLLAHKPQAHLPKEDDHWKYVHFGPATYWTQWALPIYLFSHRSDFDVFFTPGHYAPRLISIPYISSVMDTAFLDFKSEFKWQDRVKLTEWTAYSVKHAAKVLAISQATKKSVENHYHRKATDVFVSYPGPSQLQPASKSEIRSWLTKHQIDTNYFIHIGTLQPRKRLDVIIDAFERVCQAQSQASAKTYRGSAKHPPVPHLILAGKVGWLADNIVEKIQRSAWKHNIHSVGFIDDSLKAGLLKQALGLLAVGEGEGFGIPVLEAMQSGCIPIVAKTGSLPEVVGNAGMLVAPGSVNALADAMFELLYLSPPEKNRLSVVGLKQSQQFSWSESAKIVYVRLLQLCLQTQSAKGTIFTHAQLDRN